MLYWEIHLALHACGGEEEDEVDKPKWRAALTSEKPYVYSSANTG